MRIYIAAPLTVGDQARNISSALEAATVLRDAGAQPFVPHLAWFWHLCSPADYERWMEWCMAWLKACDVVLRLPGESRGADREVEWAENHGMAVVRSLDDALKVVEACQ